MEEEEEDDDNVIITHQQFPSPTHAHEGLSNQPKKVPIIAETQTKWDNYNVEMQIVEKEIMKTKKLRGGQIVEKIIKEQASQTNQKQAKGIQLANLSK